MGEGIPTFVFILLHIAVLQLYVFHRPGMKIISAIGS